MLHCVDAGISDAAGRVVDDTSQSQVVRGVVEHREVRQHVLDLGTLEELHATDDLIGYAIALEGIFKGIGLGVHAVQDRVVPPVPAAVVVAHNRRYDVVRLVGFVEHGLDGDLVAVARVRPEVFALAGGVVPDDRVGGGENVLRRAVVLL